MMRANVRPELSRTDAGLQANTRNPFKRFGKETPSEVVSQKVERDPYLELLFELLYFVRGSVFSTDPTDRDGVSIAIGFFDSSDRSARRSHQKLSVYDAPPHSIEVFCVSLPDFKDYILIVNVLNTLINEGTQDNYVIRTSRLQHRWQRVNDLCAFNCKNVTVIGDVGSMFARDAISGRIVLEGKATSKIAYRNRGADILVKGSVGDDAAEDMLAGGLEVTGKAGLFVARGLKGGNVFVREDTDCDAAQDMEGGVLRIGGVAAGTIAGRMRGGTIYLDGDYFVVAEPEGGQIFHEGVRIFPEDGAEK